MARKEIMTAKPTVRDYTGFGSGAATPDPNQPETIKSRVGSRQQQWTPTVSRQRAGAVTNPEQPAPSAPTTPKRAPTSRLTPPNVQGPSFGSQITKPFRAIKPITGMLTGVTDAFDKAAARKAASVGTAIENMNIPSIPKKILKGGATGYIESYSGGAGKAFLVGDIVSIGTRLQDVVNPDETAQFLWQTHPEEFQSLDDAKNQVKVFAGATALGSLFDNIVNVGVANGASWVATRFAASSIGAALGLSALGGPIGFALMFIATTFLMGVVQSLDEHSVVRGGGESGSIDQALLSSRINENLDLPILGNPTASGPIATGIGSLARVQLDSAIKNLSYQPANQNTPDQVTKLRLERGKMVYQMTDDNGNPTGTVNFYKSFGSRTNEVRSLLVSGYFLTPTGNMLDVPDGKGGYKKIREFYMDYQNFVRWLDDTDWIANSTGIKQRVVDLPNVSVDTLKEVRNQPISVEEASYALKSWYDSAGFPFQ